MGTNISYLTIWAGVLLCSALLLGSCSDNSTNIKKKSPFKTDVYLAGQADTNAVYWKNGTLHKLSNKSGKAHSIDVYDGDVYVAGNIYADKNNYPNNDVVYWKNGSRHNLTRNGNAASIAVYDGDVYVAGQADSSAVYWKNGKLHKLTDHGNATAIFVKNGDVYVAGWKYTSHYRMRDGVKFYIQIPVYWKNGTSHKLSDSYEELSKYPESIYVSKGDVYVAGSEIEVTGIPPMKAVYWKNKNQHTLRNGSANSIYVDGGDTYISGSEYSITEGGGYAGYWKNGTFNQLMDCKSSNSIAVFDGDVYVAGQERIGYPAPDNAIYWKNGTLHRLTEGKPRSRAISIYVTKTKVK